MRKFVILSSLKKNANIQGIGKKIPFIDLGGWRVLSNTIVINNKQYSSKVLLFLTRNYKYKYLHDI
jgi:hypothetical protein